MSWDWPSVVSVESWVPRARGPCGITYARCPRPLVPLLATLVGATFGSALRAAVVFAVLVSDGQLVAALILPFAAAYVGSSAAVGFQVGTG